MTMLCLVPKIGDKVYIPNEFYVYRGLDDLQGGLAEVDSVTTSISAGKETPFITVKENPGTSYNWLMLAERQSVLKKQFGSCITHPDPDDRPEFNDPNEGFAS